MMKDTLTKYETNLCLARDILKYDPVYGDDEQQFVSVWDMNKCMFVEFDPFEDSHQAEQVLKALGVEYTPYEDLILDALNIRLKG
jgi:hypothetical protein